MGDLAEREEGDLYFEIVRPTIQNAETPRQFLIDLQNKGKIQEGSHVYRALIEGNEVNKLLMNVAGAGVSSPAGRKAIKIAEVYNLFY